jgi:hypothetical protein
MSLFYRCPHCFAAIKKRRNLLDHFNSNPGCPFVNPDDCLSENSIGSPSLPSGPPSAHASPPYERNNEDHDEAYDPAHILPLLPTFGIHQAYNHCHEEPDSYVDNNEDDLLDVEADPDFPPLAANLILQQDSDLTDDSCDDHEYGELVDNFEHEEDDMLLFGAMGDSELNTSITGSWTLPTPENHRPIREGIIVDPVEESLLCLLIENHLPKRMYSAIMEWGHYASCQNYDFTVPPLYNTVLS